MVLSNSVVEELNCGDDFFVRATEIDPVKIYISADADLSFGNQVF